MGVAPEGVGDYYSRPQLYNLLLFLQPYYRQQLEAAAAYVCLEKERDELRTSLDQATKRAEELELKLQDQAELEKALHESQERERVRVVREKTEVDRLLSIAGALGGEFFGLVPTLSLLLFLSVDL